MHQTHHVTLSTIPRTRSSGMIGRRSPTKRLAQYPSDHVSNTGDMCDGASPRFHARASWRVDFVAMRANRSCGAVSMRALTRVGRLCDHV